MGNCKSYLKGTKSTPNYTFWDTSYFKFSSIRVNNPHNYKNVTMKYTLNAHDLKAYIQFNYLKEYWNSNEHFIKDSDFLEIYSTLDLEYTYTFTSDHEFCEFINNNLNKVYINDKCKLLFYEQGISWPPPIPPPDYNNIIKESIPDYTKWGETFPKFILDKIELSDSYNYRYTFLYFFLIVNKSDNIKVSFYGKDIRYSFSDLERFNGTPIVPDFLKFKIQKSFETDNELFEFIHKYMDKVVITDSVKVKFYEKGFGWPPPLSTDVTPSAPEKEDPSIQKIEF